MPAPRARAGGPTPREPGGPRVSFDPTDRYRTAWARAGVCPVQSS